MALKNLTKSYTAARLEYLYEAVISDSYKDIDLINPIEMDYLSAIIWLFNKKTTAEKKRLGNDNNLRVLFRLFNIFTDPQPVWLGYFMSSLTLSTWVIVPKRNNRSFTKNYNKRLNLCNKNSWQTGKYHIKSSTW
jgi:hypothetical protein